MSPFNWLPSRKSKNEELNAPLLEGSKQQKSRSGCYNVYRFWSDLLNGLFSWFCFMKAKTGKKKKTTGKKKKKKKKTTSVVLVPLPTVVDDEYVTHVDKSRRFLRVLIGINHCELDMIKLALLDASSYDFNSQAGGPNASIRFGDEYQYCCASGLKKCLEVCDQVKFHFPSNRITYADLYQLAGVVSVELLGGPTISFTPGRKDYKNVAISELLPGPHSDVDHLREIFDRMGLEGRDIVTLSVVHMGRIQLEDCISEVSPTFNNSFFRDLVKNQDSLCLDSERALVTDHELHTYVTLYAKDEDAFLRDYAISHQRFSELGFEVDQVQSRVIQVQCSRMARMAKMVVAVLLGVIAGMILAPRTLYFGHEAFFIK